jgi:hypothetical protein
VVLAQALGGVADLALARLEDELVARAGGACDLPEVVDGFADRVSVLVISDL